MNEIQIIQDQLATEQLHFAEVANACAAALGSNKWVAGSDFARACADYFAFAVTRIAQVGAVPESDADSESWRAFLQTFNGATAMHFAAIATLQTQNLPVTEWRSRSGIDADAIFIERSRYARVKQAAAP